MSETQAATALDHFYTFGDVYETLDACEQLEMMLSRLRRQRLLSDEHFFESKQQVGEIRSRIQSRLDDAALTPKGPRLP